MTRSDDDLLAAILRFGDPRLTQVCETVGANSDEDLAAQADIMLATIHAFRRRHGWGRAIAAPQLGIMQRMVALAVDGQEHILLDPVLEWRSAPRIELWDDCMSLPEIAVRVLRHDRVTVRYTRPDGEKDAFERAPPDLSELLQHEIDHLDGVLMTDRAMLGSMIVAHENRKLATDTGRHG